MRAAVRTQYGPPDVVQLREVERPVPGDNEVLLEIRAASANPYDWHVVRGEPYFIRLGGGLRAPNDVRLGMDAAGVVATVGRNVAEFRPGDEVFGFCRGSFADYASTTPDALAPKPRNLSFEQAASVPLAALTALQGLRDYGRLQWSDSVLINGASGGVGTFAVQMARTIGAGVTGVCSARNADLVRSLGADQVIDYARQDFTAGGPSYDVILDCVGNHSWSASARALKRDGRYVAVGAPAGRWMIGFMASAITAPLVSRFGRHTRVVMMTKRSKDDLREIARSIESGRLLPVIDRCYRLDHISDALRYVEQGHARGKVVVTA